MRVMIFLAILFISFSQAFASMPVEVTITGCVEDGRLISRETDFGTHKVEGRYREIRVYDKETEKIMNLSGFEGKLIKVRGFLLPGDSFFIDKKSLMIIGECKNPKQSLKEQQKLAEQIFNQLRNTREDDYGTFERLYKRVIEECPDTEQAKEAYWRLTNLYLEAFDPPKYREVVKLLEEAIYRYPNSDATPHYKKRLLFAYEKTGQWVKALELYEEPLKDYPELLNDPRNAAIMLNYAEALYNSGNSKKAAEVLRKVISFGNRIEDWMLDIAKDRLKKIDRGY